MICGLPSLDSVALIDLWCKVALFCEDLGLHYTHASSFGDCVGYTSIPWAHYGSLEPSGVDLAPKKIQFYKKNE